MSRRWFRGPKPTGGASARRATEAALNETLERWPEVVQVASSLRELRERNHFAEAIEIAMRSPRT